MIQAIRTLPSALSKAVHSFATLTTAGESYGQSSRRGTPPDTGSSHTGFRCVISGDNSQVTRPVKSQFTLLSQKSVFGR